MKTQELKLENDTLELHAMVRDTAYEQWQSYQQPICFGTRQDVKKLQEHLEQTAIHFTAQIMAASHDISLRLEQGMRFDEACDEAFEAQSSPKFQTFSMVSDTTSTSSSIPMTESEVQSMWQGEETLFVADLKDIEPWSLVALLNLGGLNDHPIASEHTAILRYWSKTYKATLIYCTVDQIMIHAQSPPTQWLGAFELAQDHVDYCPDILRRHPINLQQLAKVLKTSTTWQFKWDLEEPTESGLLL